jgi:hypothetical protein
MAETAKYVKGKKADDGCGGTGLHHHSLHTRTEGKAEGKRIRKGIAAISSYPLSLQLYDGYGTQR